jgi:hypothetical protein
MPGMMLAGRWADGAKASSLHWRSSGLGVNQLDLTPCPLVSLELGRVVEA